MDLKRQISSNGKTHFNVWFVTAGVLKLPQNAVVVGIFNWNFRKIHLNVDLAVGIMIFKTLNLPYFLQIEQRK